MAGRAIASRFVQMGDVLAMALELPEPPSANRTGGALEKALPVIRRCTANGPCYEWTGERLPGGYQRAWYRGRRAVAHRLAYELVRGPFDQTLTLDHLCRNRACINPFHLEPVSHRENCIRGTVLKTHCPHGHAYAGDNLRVYRGRRFCRECHRIRSRKRRL